KIKLCHHDPVSLFQPISILTCSFEVVSMNFISELLKLSEYNKILIIIDKLTKFSIFILYSMKITEIKTAELFFHYIIFKFEIPA
ncbi:uncharacterized protein BT62DRAFT_893456, partial [Guyanagaster necrorhizus]